MELTRVKKNNLLPIYNIKCATLGDQGVGKTTMVNTFVSKKIEYNTTATIGVSYVGVDIDLSENQSVRLKIWDTAGSEKFLSITESYIRNSYIIFIMFDLTDRHTWANVDYWKNLTKYNNNELTNIVLIACKSDLKYQTVNYEEIQEKANLWDCKWYSLSCKQENSVSMINKIFQESAERFHEKMVYNNKHGYKVPSAILDDGEKDKYVNFYEPEKKDYCCM